MDKTELKLRLDSLKEQFQSQVISLESLLYDIKEMCEKGESNPESNPKSDMVITMSDIIFRVCEACGLSDEDMKDTNTEKLHTVQVMIKLLDTLIIQRKEGKNILNILKKLLYILKEETIET